MIFLHRSRRALLAIVAFLPSAACGSAAPDQSPVAAPDARDTAPLQRSVPTIGMNLEGAGLTYWGSSYPFIDRALTLDKWSAKDTNWNNLPSSAVAINPQTRLPAGQPGNIMQVNNVFAIDPPIASRANRYVITWRGMASVEMGPNAAVNVKQGDHSYAFDYTGKAPPMLVVSKLDDRDPFRDFHIVRADQVERFKAGQMFSPDFLAKASQWSVLRFMDWGHTNGSQVSSWSQMPQATSNWGEDGAPLKVMVDLANAAGTDMWYCIPVRADDAFVRQALSYIRDHLDPKHKIHIEYSNEVWNGAFEQSQYSKTQGEALAKRLKLSGQFGDMEYYGYRSAQIAKITDEIFGATSRARARNVVGTQTYWTGRKNAIWDGVKVAKLGTPGSLFEEYAITTYFGHSFGGGSDADRAKVLDWARQGPAGLDAAFRELATGGQLSENSSLASLRGPLEYHARVAQRLGLDLVAYEGGHHLTAGGYQGKEQDEITDFIRRIAADPRTGQLYAKMIDTFGAVGGKTLVAFNDVGKTSKFGAWGVLDTIYDTGSPRYDALVAAQNRATAKR